MDLPRQLTERLPRLARRAAVENAFVHRVARRQRIRRRRHRPLVRRLCHAGEARAVAPDAQRHPGRLVAQPGAEEQVVRRHRVKLPAHPCCALRMVYCWPSRLRTSLCVSRLALFSSVTATSPPPIVAEPLLWIRSLWPFGPTSTA